MRTLCLLALSGCATLSPEVLRAEVEATETAFARTMADRDRQAFGRFVAEDAVFLNGGEPLRGRAAILAHWERFFAGAQPPFSWRPAQVEVLPSGTLAASTGPVTNRAGVVVSAFASTWRREPSGAWRIIFDNGYPVCPAPAATP